MGGRVGGRGEDGADVCDLGRFFMIRIVRVGGVLRGGERNGHQKPTCPLLSAVSQTLSLHPPLPTHPIHPYPHLLSIFPDAPQASRRARPVQLGLR